MRPSRGNPTTLTGSARGFTLLEIVIVLVLSALLMAGAIGYMVFSGSERHLRNSSGDIEILAKRARTIATLQQTPYALVIAGDGVHLMPLAEALEQSQTPAAKKAAKKGGQDTTTTVAANSRYTPIHADWTPEENDKLFVRRWASDNWLPADDRTTHIWRFDPDGICEPVTLRLQTGADYIETEYHPLTAAVRYTNLEISK